MLLFDKFPDVKVLAVGTSHGGILQNIRRIAGVYHAAPINIRRSDLCISQITIFTRCTICRRRRERHCRIAGIDDIVTADVAERGFCGFGRVRIGRFGFGGFCRFGFCGFFCSTDFNRTIYQCKWQIYCALIIRFSFKKCHGRRTK